MGKRRKSEGKYVEKVEKPLRKVTTLDIALRLPLVVTHLDKSMVKSVQVKPDWSLYRIEFRDEVPYIVREMCDRCGKVWIPPRWRKLRRYNDKDIGSIYLETGLCKDCINASVYVDKFLDGEVLGEVEAKKQFYKYTGEYEKAWRIVLAMAPRILMTEEEWRDRCTFFNGCAFCGAPIEVRAKYFPTALNGTFSPWNVIPLCGECNTKHNFARNNIEKRVSRYKVFSTHEAFNKHKTTRLYLINQMRKHDVYMEPILPYMSRFLETKQL